MNSLKNYVKNNSKTLFRYSSLITNAEFDNRGFFFSDVAQLEYNKIKDLPHLYVAWTDCEEGFIYIGKSNQKDGRWKRQHAYHLGTLAHHLLETIKYYDQNHQHWIDSWMDIKTISLGNNFHYIQLFREVKICFIPFEFYSEDNYISLNTEQINNINDKIEGDLIKSYLLDGFELLNIKHNDKAKRVKIKSPIIPSNKRKTNLELSNNINCVEFTVKKNETITSCFSKNPNLPVGKLTINIRDTQSNKVVYNKERRIRTKGRTLKEYFSSVDASGLQKWEVILNEMKQNNIEEIAVRVCPIN